MMALIWRNPNTDPAYYKCCALKHLQPSLQWPVHSLPSVFLPASQRKVFFAGTDLLKARTISIGKEKRGDVEFISMVPITVAEELAKCVCLEG